MGISFPSHFVGILFLCSDVKMKFQRNDVGISFPGYGVGTAMHGNRKSIPTTDFAKYNFKRSEDLSDIKCAATALDEVGQK